MTPELIPKKGAKIVVAMSGGVDSSVSAAWLKEQGYDVIGISLQLHDMAEKTDNKFGTCCSLSDISDARRVCEKMGIPFYVTNMESKFNSEVIEDFVQEYLNGRTPNPCVKCNEKVKFSHLMDWAMDLGADYLATGHYANIRFNADNDEYELCKGKDIEKDQSYFLFPMRQEDLHRTYFPVGNLTKESVRELAHRLELSIANKPDSQDICFVQNRSYREFIEDRVPKNLLKPGKILNTAGQVLGQHPGLHHFTIGQRKGHGVTTREPLYVVAMKKETNEIVLGPEEALYSSKCTVRAMNWIKRPNLEKAPHLKAKVRYRSIESPVRVYPLINNRIEVHFEQGQRAITSGQSLVLYDGDAVVGGGWIEEILYPKKKQPASG